MSGTGSEANLGTGLLMFAKTLTWTPENLCTSGLLPDGKNIRHAELCEDLILPTRGLRTTHTQHQYTLRFLDKLPA